MKKITLIVLLFGFYSCQIQYDGETRLITEIHVVDSDGNPIQGQPVEITVHADNISDVISNGNTDQNGNSLLIFPKPLQSTISVAFYDHDDIYQDKMYVGILIADFENFKLTMDPVVLYRIDQLTTVNLVLDHVSANTQILSTSLDGQQPEEHIDYHPSDPGYSETPTIFSVVKNQTVNLTYSVIDYNSSPAIVTDHTIAIIVGNEPVNQVITY